MTHLELLEKQAIDLIRSASRLHSYVVSYSGGKDSEVLLHLFKLAGVNFSLVYRSTTIDPPHTISHVRSRGAVILRPTISFFGLIQKKGLPSFARRFCCSVLKEGYFADYVALGIRRIESTRRARRYQEPEVCRIYSKSQVTFQLLPLINWLDDDIRDYILSEDIQCHPLYYDDMGHFCVNRRLGCLGCPLPADRSINDFKQYPLLVRQWCRNLAVFRQKHHESKACTLFTDEFEQFSCNLFFRKYSDYLNQNKGLFPYDCKRGLEEYFGVNLNY